MTGKLTIPDFQKMIQQALSNVTARAGEFSELDAVIDKFMETKANTKASMK